jgi:NitT/TauT family transport system permease protein
MSFNPPRSVSAAISIAEAAPAKRRKWLRAFWLGTRETALPIVVVVVLLVLWEALVPLLAIPVYILPAPSRIAASVWAMRGLVAMHTMATLWTVLAGFALSIVLALPLAAFITMSWFGRVAVYPLLILSQSIPKIALTPILVLLFGTNVLPKIIITLLVAFFPLVVTTATGLSAVPKELIELGRSLHATWWKQLFWIRFPYATPFIFSGLKMAITLAVIGAVVGEFVAADRGLGFLMTSSLASFNTPVAYGAIVVLSLMAMALFQTVVITEQLLFPWSARVQR